MNGFIIIIGLFIAYAVLEEIGVAGIVVLIFLVWRYNVAGREEGLFYLCVIVLIGVYGVYAGFRDEEDKKASEERETKEAEEKLQQEAQQEARAEAERIESARQDEIRRQNAVAKYEREERERATREALARAELVKDLENAAGIKIDKDKAGWVYILQFNSNVYKIGHTQRHPKQRANEWGLSLCAYAKAEDSAACERAIHGYLSQYRQGKYELFEVDFKTALHALNQVVGKPEIVKRPSSKK